MNARSSMRVAHVMMTLHVGGLERMVATLATGGRLHGLDSEVWAYAEDGAFRHVMQDDGVTVRHFATNPGIRPGLAVRLAHAIRTHRIDVVHTHHVGPFLYGGLAARIARVPHIHTEHSHELYDRPRRRLLGRAMPVFSRVVCVSHELRAYRAETFGDAPTVIPNGVPVPPAPSAERRATGRARMGVPADAFVVGCVARLMPEKDHATLIAAFASVVAAIPDARLVLIGWGDLSDDLVALAAQLGISTNVLQLGGRDDVEALLPGLDVISLSSTREGLPLALLEGMAAGVPVVATDVGEVRALVDGGCGSVCEPNAPDALASLLLAYARDPERRRSEGAAGRARVIANYSGEAMVAAYNRVYRATWEATQ
jgi:glycosyltransferase involved in cell wall biosynthesis